MCEISHVNELTILVVSDGRAFWHLGLALHCNVLNQAPIIDEEHSCCRSQWRDVSVSARVPET